MANAGNLTHAISLWQPMAWAIAHGTKRIENRSWKFADRHRGKVVGIHAAKKYDRAYAELVCDVMGLDNLPHAAHDQGAIIGVMRLVRALRYSEMDPGPERVELELDPWYMGDVGWIVDSVHSIPRPIPCRGRQQIWTMNSGVRQVLLDQLEEVGAYIPCWPTETGD